MYSHIEINADNISDGLNGFGKQKYYTQKIMAKNVSQWILIILEQNFPSDQEVTNKLSNIYKNLVKSTKLFMRKRWIVYCNLWKSF